MQIKSIITFCLLFLIVVAYFMGRDYYIYNRIKDVGSVDTCVTNVHGSIVDCYFNINGKVGSDRSSKFNQYLRSGEYYKLYYHVDYPGYYYVSFSEPIFDLADFSVGKMEEMEAVADGILFTYRVDDIKYKRIQLLEGQFSIKERDKYSVIYRLDNPEIAYMVKIPHALQK